MSNLTILERNTLAGLSDDAGDLYLRRSVVDELRAFRMANEWERVSALASPMVAMAEALHGKPDTGVIEFMRERQFRRYFPGGRSSA